MSNALILHHYWNRLGGGQLVCASVAYALNSIGLNPLLVSPAAIRVEKYPEWYGINLSKYGKYSTKIELKAFGIYLRLMIGYVGKRALRKYNAKLVFTDESTYKPMIKEVRRKQVSLIEYIHFPPEVLVNPKYRGSGLYYGEDPYILKRYSRFPLNAYWKLYTVMLPHFIRENPFEVASVVLTNSRWTANVAKDIYGETPEVLNPPLPPAMRIVEWENIRPFDAREEAVVLVGRFSEEKRYHWILAELFPALRHEVENVKLYVFGGAGTKTSMNYLTKLLKLAGSLGFKASTDIRANADIYLIPDAPRKEIIGVLDTSKLFLHATMNEHWGIAVAEAMSRGLPILIHKSGGAWSDLAKLGEFGLGYTDLDDALKNAVLLLNDEKTWNYYARKSLERVRDLTLDNFSAKLINIIKNKVTDL